MQFNNLKRACLLFFILITITVAFKAFAQQQGEPIYTAVEKSAIYPGGLDALYRYIGSNIHYPQEARIKGVSGAVFITFVVEKDGSLDNFKVLRGIGFGCDEEALRVLQSSAKWTPGEQNGKAIRQQYTIPIRFKLGGKN